MSYLADEAQSDAVTDIESPTWHPLAIGMNDDGFTQQQIADEIGLNQRTIGRFLQSIGASSAEPAESWQDDPSEYTRQPRKIREVLKRKAMPEAIRAFAAGEIDRAELMRRITA